MRWQDWDLMTLAGRLRTLLAPPVMLTTPLTSTSWDGDSKGIGDNGIIDLSAVFGVPAGVKAVAICASVKSGSAGGDVSLGPNSTYFKAIRVAVEVANMQNHGSGVVPCDANGDIYAVFSTTVDEVVLRVWGYWYH